MTDLTAQQTAIIDTCLSGPPAAVIKAGAGTGKTFTVVQVADRFADFGVRGIYIALNKKVAAEVGSKFNRGNIEAMTIHSLAYRVARRLDHVSPLLSRVGDRSAVPRWKVAKHMDYATTFRYPTSGGAPGKLGLDTSSVIGANRLLTHGLEALRRWCASADESVGTDHVERIDDMDEELHTEQFAPLVAKLAQWMWDTDITSPDGKLFFTHDYYLKMVSLAHPDLTEIWPYGSLLFLDEAQDARPAMLSIIKDQINRMRLVAVGDSNQGIYRFTGAQDALPQLAEFPGAKTLELTQSFRFGPAVADKANEILDLLGDDMRLHGLNTIDSTVSVHHPDQPTPDTTAVLVRTNARMIGEVIDAQASGHKVSAVADTDYVVAIMEDMERIIRGQQAKDKALKHLTGEAELKSFADPETGDAGDMGPLLRIGLSKEPRAVITAMNACVAESAADVTISTMHKSKGREWPSVLLAVDPDEIIPGLSPRIPAVGPKGELKPLARDALMLLYVSITRAERQLYIPADLSEAIGELGRKIRRLR